MQTEPIQIVIEAIQGQLAALQETQTKLDTISATTTAMSQQQASLGQQFKASWTEINSAIGVAKQAYQLLKKVVDETIGSFVEYADQVRTISQVTGQSSEEVSRIIQLTDDYKIKTETLNVVMRNMAKEGLPLTIDALASLSDEYLNLNPGTERQLFLTEKFGRAGADFAEIMLAGGDAIRAQSEAISDSLILTDEAVQKARDYEIAMDNLNDAVEGLKIAIGEGLTPVLTRVTESFTLLIDGSNKQSKQLEILQGAYEDGIITLGEYDARLITLGLSTENQTAAQREITAVMEYWQNRVEATTTSISDATTQTDIFTGAIIESADALKREQAEFGFIIGFAKQYETNLAAVTTAEDDLRAAEETLAAARAKWPEGNQHIIDAQTAVDGLKAKLGEAQQASLDATNEMIAGFLQAQLTADGSFTEEDITKVLNYRLAVGLLSDEAYEAALNALHIAQNLASIPSISDYHVNLYETHYVDTVVTGGGDVGGGGGGGTTVIPMQRGGPVAPNSILFEKAQFGKSIRPHSYLWNESPLTRPEVFVGGGGGQVLTKQDAQAALGEMPTIGPEEISLSQRSIRDLADALYYKLAAVL